MEVLTLVLAGGKGGRLQPLTKDRSKPAVPFGGKYRIIDFTLSNCYNSGIRDNINIFIQSKPESLNEHLTDNWIKGGLGLYTRFPGQGVEGEWYKGSADAIRHNLHIIRNKKPDYVLVLSGDHIYKMDYRTMLDYHKERGADLTISTIEVPMEDAGRLGVLEVDDDSRIVDFKEKPKELPETGIPMVSMGVYVFNSEALIKALNEEGDELGRDILPKISKMPDKFNIFAYPYTEKNKIRDYIRIVMESGMRDKVLSECIPDSHYWRDIGTIASYYAAQMDLVSIGPIFNLYGEEWPVMTAPGDKTPPAKLRDGSLISEGCIIGGNSNILRSVLSPYVCVEDAEAIESILFEGVQVGRGARIRRAIIDKYISVPPGTYIGYNLEEDKKRSFVDESGIVVMPKGFEF